MAKFNAGELVERLEFDFTDYGGNQGVIDEPTTGRVNTYFASIKSLIREVKQLQAAGGALEGIDIEELDGDELTAKMTEIDEATSGAADLQNRTVEFLAILCGAERIIHDQVECDETHASDCPGFDIVGGSPTYDDLKALPHRVLQAFTTWLIEEIKPKTEGPAGKR